MSRVRDVDLSVEENPVSTSSLALVATSFASLVLYS